MNKILVRPIVSMLSFLLILGIFPLQAGSAAQTDPHVQKLIGKIIGSLKAAERPGASEKKKASLRNKMAASMDQLLLSGPSSAEAIQSLLFPNLQKGSEEEVLLLGALLRHPVGIVARQAAGRLRDAGPKAAGALPDLLTYLRGVCATQKGNELNVNGFPAIIKKIGEPAVPFLVEAMGDSSSCVRQNIIAALEEIPSEDARAAVKRFR